MLSSFSARFAFGASSPVGGGGINPNDVPGLVLWLDASDYGTLTISRPNTVTAWADKSELGYDAVTDPLDPRPLGIETPTFSTSGGKNGVVFSNCRMCTDCIPATGAGGRTILIVTSEASYSPVVNSFAQVLHYGTSVGFYSGNTFTTYGIFNYRVAQHVYGNSYNGGGVDATFETSESGTHSEAKVISSRYNGTVDAWKANNNSIGSNTVYLNTAVVFDYYRLWQPEGITLGSRIGRIDPSRGPGPEQMCNSVKVHEVLAYDNAISDSDWDGVVNYLKNKWNII